MSKTRQGPLSGYSLDNVYTASQELKHKEPSDSSPRAKITFGWDWRFVGRSVFEVRIDVTVEPTKARDDFAGVSLVGRFSQLGPTPALPLTDFVKLQAVAILLPYVRQSLSTLTASSFHGAFYLPPVNVHLLMKDLDPEKTTGARQLEKPQKASSRVLSAKRPKRRSKS